MSKPFLTRRLRIALELSASGQLSQAQAAQMCGIKQAAFAMRLARARRKMGVKRPRAPGKILVYPIGLGFLRNL